MAMTDKQVRDIVAKRNAKLAQQQRPKGVRVRASALYGQLGQASPEMVRAVDAVVKGLTFRTK